jgi:hypothetical protein
MPRALDAGHPATALLGLKDTFVNSPTCYFADLKPLWARACGISAGSSSLNAST